MNTELKAISDSFLKKIKREAITPNRQESAGVISQTNRSGVLIDSNNTQVVTDILNQSKASIDSNSQTDICYEKNIIANRINLNSDDVFLNGDRINPQLYTLSSFSQNDICTQGDFGISGTVLVKCFDKSLNKVVYIRRKVRVPIMYSTITSASIDPQFGINIEDEQVTI